MMTSFLDNIPTIVKVAAEMRPKRVLDVGAGFGKYGLLIREALLSMQAEEGDMFPNPNFVIDACENSAYFLTHLLSGNIYDSIHPSDIREMSDHDLSTYDLILLIDVIEHWPKDNFLRLMEKIPVTTKVLVSTPREVVFYEQPYYGIDKHQTQFTPFDFTNERSIDFSTKDSLIYLI